MIIIHVEKSLFSQYLIYMHNFSNFSLNSHPFKKKITLRTVDPLIFLSLPTPKLILQGLKKAFIIFGFLRAQGIIFSVSRHNTLPLEIWWNTTFLSECMDVYTCEESSSHTDIITLRGTAGEELIPKWINKNHTAQQGICF